MPNVHQPKLGKPQRDGRLTWAVAAVADALVIALERDTSEQAVRLRDRHKAGQAAALAQIIMEQADPTANKKFTPWLVRQYAAGHLILEEMGTAYETLVLFQRYASRLMSEQRDIQRYESLAAAWEAVRAFSERDDLYSNKAQRALDRAKAYAESRVLRQDPDGFTVAVPLTEFAAKWWGRGTRWCTAAEKSNQFMHYHRQAPLIVAIIPGLGKFQIWVTQHALHFMDASDEPVGVKLIEDNWKYFNPLVSCAFNRNVLALRFVPKSLRDDLLCRMAVEQNGMALEYVPRQLRTESICRIAVTRDARAVEFVPEQPWVKEIYRIAVTANGMAIQFLPEQQRNDALAHLAVTKDWRSLQYIPERLLTERLCRIAIKGEGSSLQSILRLIPGKVCTKAFFRFAVERNSRFIGSVPARFRDKKLYYAAIERDGMALDRIPSYARSKEICKRAVISNGRALQYVPETLRGARICHMAVQQDGSALQWVPATLRTKRLCRDAVIQNAHAFFHVPHHLQSQELREIAKTHEKWWSLALTPEVLRDAQMCRIAVERDGRALQYVPEFLRTDELCCKAVDMTGWALSYVPEVLRTEALCRMAVTRNGGALQHVPYECRTREICRLAIQQNSLALEHVPPSLITEDMVRIAVKKSIQALDYVPQHLREHVTVLLAPSIMTWTPHLLDQFEKEIIFVEAGQNPLAPTGGLPLV